MNHKHLCHILIFIIMLVIGGAGTAAAKIDFAALTDRQSVQTTIYKKADLTLVRDTRTLRFIKGMNFLKFSWANTKIDPTSLSIEIKKNIPGLEIVEISYPPGSKDMGIWHITAPKACIVPVEITYFTSGLSWASFYTVILSPDLQTCTITNHVNVSNFSGEDYTNAQTRLVVGKVNILDRIATLARRKHPFGMPVLIDPYGKRKGVFNDAVRTLEAAPVMKMMATAAPVAPKKIQKKSLSEYFLYTIEGQETIQTGWSKRLLSFTAQDVKIKSIFRFEVRRFGRDTVRFLSIKNDKENNLGITPLPGGLVNVFQTPGQKGSLNYIGRDATKYIPVGKQVELNLGKTQDIKIEPIVTAFEKSNIIFDDQGMVSGFDETKTYRITFSNFSNSPALAEYTHNLDSSNFKIDGISQPDLFEKVDKDTLKLTISLAPHTVHHIDFTITSKRGDRRWQP